MKGRWQKSEWCNSKSGKAGSGAIAPWLPWIDLILRLILTSVLMVAQFKQEKRREIVRLVLGAICHHSYRKWQKQQQTQTWIGMNDFRNILGSKYEAKGRMSDNSSPAENWNFRADDSHKYLSSSAHVSIFRCYRSWSLTLNLIHNSHFPILLEKASYHHTRLL